MSTNLGNLNKRLRLQCQRCGWPPPEDMPMEGVQLHFQVDHDTDGVALELIPACRCGEAMTLTTSATHSGITTDFFRCGVDGTTGHTTRKADKS